MIKKPNTHLNDIKESITHVFFFVIFFLYKKKAENNFGPFFEVYSVDNLLKYVKTIENKCNFMFTLVEFLTPSDS